MQQWLRCHRAGQNRELRFDNPRRDDARNHRARNTATHKRYRTNDPDYYGHKVRGGEYHGQGGGQQNRRLPHQTCQSIPGAAVD